jgi:hypothetical protein
VGQKIFDKQLKSLTPQQLNLIKKLLNPPGIEVAKIKTIFGFDYSLAYTIGVYPTKTLSKTY